MEQLAEDAQDVKDAQELAKTPAVLLAEKVVPQDAHLDAVQHVLQHVPHNALQHVLLHVVLSAMGLLNRPDSLMKDTSQVTVTILIKENKS